MSSSSPVSSMPQELHEVSLTSQEQELFAYLQSVQKHSHNSNVGDLRVCGGWVRDKLLGRDNNDVDIVLEAMTAQEFVECINKFERDHDRKPLAAGVMKANPGQSKHLEVVTIRIGGMGQVDFVNMRAALFSRADGKPEAFGTPEQDAKCRDFTINSLFFNLSTRQVEDLTGQGLDDLRNRNLRTPIDPRETLLDGPMCVLRAVRFASQFDMQLHASLRAAIGQAEVKDALANNVSRERVGSELVRILSGTPAQSACAVQLLHELRLWTALLLPSSLLSVVQQDGIAAEYGDVGENNGQRHEIWSRSCAYALQMMTLMAAKEEDVDDATDMKKLRLLACLVLPFAGHRVVQRDVSLPVYMLRESLKLRLYLRGAQLKNQNAKDIDGMVLKHLPKFQSLVHEADFDRVQVALLIREMKALWKVCRDVALAKELVESGSTVSYNDGQQRLRRPEEETRAIYSAFSANVAANGLGRVWELEPLISGRELVKELKMKPGIAIRETLEKVFVWQIQNPLGTRCEWLAAHFSTTT